MSESDRDIEREIVVDPAWYDALEGYLQADERFFQNMEDEHLLMRTATGKLIAFKRGKPA